MSIFDVVANGTRSARLQRAVDDPTLDTDRVLYHWTEADDIQSFKPSSRGKLGAGIYTAPVPNQGERYVNLKSGKANVLPLYARQPIAKAADKDAASEQAIANLGGRGAGFSSQEWKAETNRVLQEQGFTGVEVGGAQPEINIFDSKDLRSVHADFDPSKKNDPNIMSFEGGGGLKEAAVNSALSAPSAVAPTGEYNGLTNQMIDALADQMGGTEKDRRNAEYLSMAMDFVPFLGAAKGISETYDAYKNDDYLGMGLGALGTLASAIPFGRAGYKGVMNAVDGVPEVNRDTDLLQRVGDPDSVNSLEVEYSGGDDLVDNPMVTADQIVNRPFVTGMADTSRGALETLESINGDEYKVLMEGGQDYMRQGRNVDRGVLWASDKGAITTMMNNAEGAMKLEGAKGAPLFMPYQMGGTSTDFATMTTDLMVPYAKRNMSKKAKKLVDKRIREGAGNMKDSMAPQPDWVGIDSPDAEKWLRQAGSGRKAVAKALDEFRGEGSLNLSQARAMVVDPNQINPRVGNLQNVGVFDMNSDPISGLHSTYNTDIMGSHMGRFGQGVNVLTDMNPVIRTKGLNFVDEMTRRGHDVNAAKVPAPVGKTMQTGLIGVLDERTVEELVKKGFVAP